MPVMESAVAMVREGELNPLGLMTRSREAPEMSSGPETSRTSAEVPSMSMMRAPRREAGPVESVAVSAAARPGRTVPEALSGPVRPVPPSVVPWAVVRRPEPVALPEVLETRA